MAHRTNNTELSPAIRSLLLGLRRRIRAYVWAEAIGTIAIGVIFAFWITLAIDWLFEPSSGVRRLLLIATAFSLALIVYRALLRKCFARLSDQSMALLIERRFSQLQDGLLTTVELAKGESDPGAYDDALLAQVRDNADRAATDVRLRRIFDFRPLARVTAAALLLAGTLALFCVLVPEAFATWERRLLALSDEPWPRATHLTVEGFDSGPMKVARGDDVEVVVLADLTKVVPEVVTLFYETKDASRRRVNMNRHGNAIANRVTLSNTAHQRFSYSLKNVQNRTTLDVRGGDARVRGLEIIPVEPPTLTDITLYCEFPTYLVDEETGAFTAREIPLQGAASLPKGTSVEVRATANKDLASVRWQDSRAPETWHTIQGADTSIRFPLERIDENATISIVLADTDGIQNRRATDVAIRAKQDQPPEVAVELLGIGSDVTPNARLPFRGNINDDYGVTHVSFEYQHLTGDLEQRRVASPATPQTQLDLDHVEELEPLGLQPGDEIQVAIAAADTLWLDRKKRLADAADGKDSSTVLAAIEANVGRSQPYSLRVVTPERLRSILATREWTLTRRFKQLIRDIEQMRDSLARIQFDDSVAIEEARKVQTRRLGLLSAAQRASRSASRGMRDLADDFERIVIELENNRISTKDLRPRLVDRVAKQLRKIASDPVDTLITALDSAQSTVRDPERGPEDRDFAVQQADAVLAEMNRVLKAMKASEEFNAMLERVRELMEEQSRLQAETEKARKAAERKALDLLGD
ncbi:MAG: DUF4175 domain-containing protein [Pirellulales bacterium]|nr:DUF4175 domain-containing protein [Pirellulales bacterium]